MRDNQNSLKLNTLLQMQLNAARHELQATKSYFIEKNQQLHNELDALQSEYDNLLEPFKKAQADAYSLKTETTKKNTFNEAETSADLSKPEPDGMVDEASAPSKQDHRQKPKGKVGTKAYPYP